MKKLPLFHRWREMVRCKAGEILRSEAYFMYAAATKGEAERRGRARWPFIASLIRGCSP